MTNDGRFYVKNRWLIVSLFTALAGMIGPLNAAPLGLNVSKPSVEVQVLKQNELPIVTVRGKFGRHFYRGGHRFRGHRSYRHRSHRFGPRFRSHRWFNRGYSRRSYRRHSFRRYGRHHRRHH